MAEKENKRRAAAPVLEESWSEEIRGIAWISIGLLLSLSILRYSPADLPRWEIFEPVSGPKEAVGRNLIGPVGGILGFLQFFLFGAAACLLPVGLIWFGIVKLVKGHPIWPRKSLGLLMLLLSGAMFLHAGKWFFSDWAHRCQINSPGGVMGELFGGILLQPFIARAGVIIVALAAYAIATVMLGGHHPLRFAKASVSLGMAKYARWKAMREADAAAHSREARLATERDRQREQRRLEREAARSAKEAATPAPEPQAQLALREVPEPQIIDASQRRHAEPLQPGAKPFERKKNDHQFLSTDDFANYELPGFDLLDDDIQDDGPSPESHRAELLSTQANIIGTLQAFGIEVTPGDITRGPTITRYEIYPTTGLRVSRISQLEADLARATCAERINILAPIPGKDTVGIEIANSKKVAVPLHELLHDPEFRSAKKKIPLALGKDVYGKTVIGDLAAMPHLLVAGATGSGKSVCINSIIASMLFKFGPDELRFIMVDPKVVEMQMYNRLPHLVVPVVTDPKKTVAALKWVVNEMEKRYRIFAKEGVRNFDSFNNRPRPEKTEAEKTVAATSTPPWEAEPEVNQAEIEAIAAALESGDLGPEMSEEEEFEMFEEKIPDRFPYIVVLIDELADLMQTAPADVEMCIARIAQKARAAGIHLIIATQTPRADVVTGIIKANIPCRIAFQVSSQLDSRVILDTKGAEKLVGKGDMLYLPPGSAKLERSQGAFVTDEEIERIIEHCAKQGSPKFETDIHASLSADDDGGEEEISSADEELILKCIDVARQEQKCSTSLLQRRLRLGYTRAARMLDILEQRGIVGPGDGAKPREVFVK